MIKILRWSLGLVLLMSTSAWAQLNPGVPIEFDFLNPGARNLGLAGVAGGLADDATAALTNPAGLAILARPEISAELRAKRTSHDVLSGGRLDGTLDYSTFNDTNAGLNFISAVYPAGRVVVGAYRHELARIGVSGQRGAIGIGNSLFAPVTFDRSIDITTYGGSVGIKVANQFAVGFGVSAAQVNADTTIPVDAGGRNVKGTGVGANVGLHITPNPNVRFGVSYRRGAQIDAEENGSSSTVTLKVPDVLAAGIMVRPKDELTLAIDVSRVAYSDLEEFYYLDEIFARLSVSDATEIHAAAEYVFTQSRFLPAVRVGTWYDPAHSPEVAGTRFTDPLRRQLADAIYRPADDTIHGTGGVGFVVKTGFEMNVGVDISSKAKLFSASFIARF